MEFSGVASCEWGQTMARRVGNVIQTWPVPAREGAVLQVYNTYLIA
jgi:hypothetical protein